MAEDLNQFMASLFKINPQLRRMPFDPQGTGYDYDTAVDMGMGAGQDAHWGSRSPLDAIVAQSLGLPEGSGIMLKGATHPTWDKALAGEKQAGYGVLQGQDGRYYSVPQETLREDNTLKAKGYFGGLPATGGKQATEISIGVNFDGQERLIPALNPLLDLSELTYLLTGGQPTKPIVDKAVTHARQRMTQGLNPFAGNNEVVQQIPQSKQETALGLFPIRQPFSSELDYFRQNPNVAGMAAEDNTVILNPHNPNMSDPAQRNSVIQNEGIRLLINALQAKPTFQVTPDQRSFFAGTPYASDEQKMRETIAARIFSGDPSAGTATPEQLEYVNFLRQHIPR